MTPADIPAELVETAARAWWEHDAEGMATWCDQMGVESDPTWDEISDADREHVRESIAIPILAAVWDEVQARALQEACEDWSRGEWADAPRRADRVQERIANGQHVGEWLRTRAARLRTPNAGEGCGDRG